MLRFSSVKCACSTSGWLCRTSLLLGNAGVPKKKKSPFQVHRKTYGVHFKIRNLRMQPWYYCPLCAEPKRLGEYCRREDCRQIKP